MRKAGFDRVCVLDGENGKVQCSGCQCQAVSHAQWNSLKIILGPAVFVMFSFMPLGQGKSVC